MAVEKARNRHISATDYGWCMAGLGISLGVTIRDCLRLRLARPGGLPLGSATHF